MAGGSCFRNTPAMPRLIRSAAPGFVHAGSDQQNPSLVADTLGRAHEVGAVTLAEIEIEEDKVCLVRLQKLRCVLDGGETSHNPEASFAVEEAGQALAK